MSKDLTNIRTSGLAQCPQEVVPHCVKAPPMFTQWCTSKTPYPAGSIVFDSCGCLWGHLCPDGEYSPPGKGTWKPINPMAFASLLIDPVAFLVRHMVDAMSCTDLTSRMVYKVCDTEQPTECNPVCIIVKQAIHTGCYIPPDCGKCQ